MLKYSRWRSQDNNAVIRTWCPEGMTVEKRDCLSHHEVLTRLDGYDPDRGVKVVGHRGTKCSISRGNMARGFLGPLHAGEMQRDTDVDFALGYFLKRWGLFLNRQ